MTACEPYRAHMWGASGHTQCAKSGKLMNKEYSMFLGTWIKSLIGFGLASSQVQKSEEIARTLLPGSLVGYSGEVGEGRGYSI